MMHFRKAIAAAAVLIASQSITANAANLLPPPVVEAVPEPVAVHDYYLRAFVDITNQEIDAFTSDVIAAGPFTIVDHDFDSAPFIGLGIGHVHSGRFRFDLNGEYRGKSDFHGLEAYTGCAFGAGAFTNEYTSIKSERVFLANSYWDIGTATVTLDNFNDMNQLAGALHWAKKNSDWKPA